MQLANQIALLPTPTVGDSKAARNSTANRASEPPTGVHAGDTLTDAVSLLPTPRSSDANGGGAHGDGGLDLRTVIADAHRPLGDPERGAGEAVSEPGEVERPGRRDRVAWGDHEAAIRRHERALGRPAPAPTDERGRLAVPFVEWMQMLPEGWVDGMTRTAALKCLGNCVVSTQAIAAIRSIA
jgi:DNA (cytosine-5)-methyltransferase 1